MYAWIWRRLPFGLRGKIVGSLLLVAAVVALLWYVVFPVIEPIMPFNNGQLTDTGGVPTSGPAAGPSGPPVSPGAG
jgi:hypothetical protein